MKFIVEEKTVRFFPEGRIDTSNANVFENEISAALTENPGHIPLFDMSELTYISSAGLRILLKTLQKTEKKLRLINVSDEVYEILSVTGFTDIFNVQKEAVPLVSDEHIDELHTVRAIDVSQYVHSYSDDVIDTYITNDDTTIQLYSPRISLEIIRKNKSKSEISLKAGVPVLISFDIVSCGNKYGIIYENIKNSEPLILKMQKDKAHIADYSAKLALWTKKINSINMSGIDLESASRYTVNLINRLKTSNLLRPSEADSLTAVIKNAPETNTYCHNDITPHNIIASGDDFIAINAFMAAKGHAVHDLASVAWYFKLLPQIGVDSQAVSFTDSEKALFWDTYIKAYFGTDNENFLYKAEYQILQFASAKFLTTAITMPDLLNRTAVMKLKRMALSMADTLTPICF